jgi:maltose-binding protein MalE
MWHRQKCKLWCLFVVVALLVSACQGQGQSVGENPSDTAPPGSSDAASSASDNPDEITMEVYIYDDSHLKNAAMLYEERVGVKVNVQKNFVELEYNEFDFVDKFGISSTAVVCAESFPDTSIYTERALADLMAGGGADIYNVSYLDFKQLGRNGLLIDMGSWLENDAELTDDAVFRDILLSGRKTWRAAL